MFTFLFFVVIIMVVLQVSLVTLLFQACVRNSSGLHEAADSVLRDVLEQVDCWTAYQIGRQAARYGHHQTAARIFGSLTSKVTEIGIVLIL